jgi:FtsP/CotA-like multicopper oxidase with cupredoxin domain
MLDFSRRQFLQGASGALVLSSGVLGSGRANSAASDHPPVSLVAHPVSAKLDGHNITSGLMSWSDKGMPPVIRTMKGQPFSARLTNRLDEPTTIHWHGVRVPQAMDGVPFLSQPYVYSGDHFDYAFSPPDAGTFWYHPHCNTLTQMGRGMTGLFIVENPDDPVFDAEFALNLRDFRLDGKGQFIDQFRLKESAKAGTYGTVRTCNWSTEPLYDAPAGGLVRLRIVATDVTRIYSLMLSGASASVVALDGQPVEIPFPLDTQDIAPGQRADLILRMPDNEGEIVQLMNVRGNQPFTVASFRAVGQSRKRALGDVRPLAANEHSEPDMANAVTIPFELTATAESAPKESLCGTLGATFWAINRIPWTGDTSDTTAPLAELKLGKTYIIQLSNRTPHAHPIHLHGMNFRLMTSTKRALRPVLTDTYLSLPDETVTLCLVADNPGDWVFHCHIIEHQKSGMAGFLRVT